MSGPVAAGVAADAVISPCGRYRYLLSRSWAPSRGSVGFVMCNPSTADAHRDDPTVRRCIGFARGWGFGALRIANAFALRTADPTVLLDVVAVGGDPVGPDNPRHLRGLGEEHTVVLAWGTNAAAVLGAGYLDEVLGELTVVGAQLVCLAVNQDGSPRHPLYVPEQTRPIPWRTSQ